jgi:lactam utilization protein B
MYLRGALDSAHFHRMRKATIYQIDAAGKLCRYQTRTLSYIKAKIINVPRTERSGKNT